MFSITLCFHHLETPGGVRLHYRRAWLLPHSGARRYPMSIHFLFRSAHYLSFDICLLFSLVPSLLPSPPIFSSSFSCHNPHPSSPNWLIATPQQLTWLSLVDGFPNIMRCRDHSMLIMLLSFGWNALKIIYVWVRSFVYTTSSFFDVLSSATSTSKE